MTSTRVSIRTKILTTLKKAPRKHRIVESVPPVKQIHMRAPTEVIEKEVNPLKGIGKSHA